LFANVFLELLAQRAGEFHDFAAVEAQKMLMLSCWFYLIVMVLFGEVMLFYQPQLLEKLQVSVDRGQADPGVPPPCPAIQLIGINMPLAPPNKVKEQGALSCHSLT